jgi:hypothetical protein
MLTANEMSGNKVRQSGSRLLCLLGKTPARSADRAEHPNKTAAVRLANSRTAPRSPSAELLVKPCTMMPNSLMAAHASSAEGLD